MDLENYDKNKNPNSFKFPIKMSKFINLDMGQCYVGFLQDSQNGNCAVDILGWKMIGFNVFNNEDAWNGLTLEYEVKWPLNMMLSQQVIEKYKTLFRYFFPIRYG